MPFSHYLYLISTHYFNRDSLLNRANASAASIAAAESASIALLKRISASDAHSSTPAASPADATASTKSSDDESDDDGASSSAAKPLAGQDVALVNGFLVDVYTKQNRIAEAVEVRNKPVSTCLLKKLFLLFFVLRVLDWIFARIQIAHKLISIDVIRHGYWNYREQQLRHANGSV